MPPRLSERLNAVRFRRFIGRSNELEIFKNALAAPELPFNVLFVYGPGGVGKSSLLAQFARLCAQANLNALNIDARNIEASPESFLTALGMTLGLAPTASPQEALAAQGGRQVILVDTYELLAPLDDWLRESFLPELPQGTLFVTASRHAPNLAWRMDPGWQPLVRIMPLRNLSPDEGRAYLTLRAIPSTELQAVLDFTHSYPLALSLVADLYDQRPGFVFRPEVATDMVKTLIEHLLRQVPGQVHRAALEASALVRVTTESLLAEMVGGQHVAELFDWLRTLSFMDTRPGGLFPHDLAREALVADLRWRNPDGYAELHRRARAYYIKRIEQGHGPEQQLALFDLIFLHRDNPVVRPVFEWQASGRVLPSPLQPADLPRLESMVLDHEGVESARLARHWLTTQPEGVIVFRDGEGQPTGFVTFVNLGLVNDEDLRADPALAAAAHLLDQSSPLRPGERATYFRHWMAAEGYQGVSPTQSLIFINMVRHYLTTPGLAFTFVPCAQPDFWTPVFTYADLARLPDADFQMDGRHFGVFGHDWRATPPSQWLNMLGEREIAMTPLTVQPPTPVQRLVVLSQDGFGEAVAAALRGLARPDGLAENPLLQSRLVVQRVGSEATSQQRMAALRGLVMEAVAALDGSPKEAKLHRAIYHTYVQPAPTQESAAELIDVPFSSYRRHLKSGIERIADLLWRREVGG